MITLTLQAIMCFSASFAIICKRDTINNYFKGLLASAWAGGMLVLGVDALLSLHQVDIASQPVRLLVYGLITCSAVYSGGDVAKIYRLFIPVSKS